MEEIKSENRSENAMAQGIKLNKNVSVPDYFKKRERRMQDSFKDSLNKTANSDPVKSDEYGEYRTGTFLHRACLVGVRYDAELDLWSVEAISERPITLLIIQEIRDKFVPDDCIMAMMFPKRSDRKENSAILYEIPSNQAE